MYDFEILFHTLPIFSLVCLHFRDYLFPKSFTSLFPVLHLVHQFPVFLLLFMSSIILSMALCSRYSLLVIYPIHLAFILIIASNMCLLNYRLVLSSCIHVLFINDIHTASNISLHIHADDIVILARDADIRLVSIFLHHNLNMLKTWLDNVNCIM